MQETPKNKETGEEKDGVEDSWGEDQKEKAYYYDDAHGYETFEPDAEDESAEEECATS